MNPKTPKLNQNWFASPDGCSSPPSSSSKPRNWVDSHVSPGGQARTARRFLIWNLETDRNGDGSLGDFEDLPGSF